MSEEIKYSLVFMILGGLAIILGNSIKKSDLPSLIARKYLILIFGCIFFVYGMISLIVNIIS